MHKRGTLSSRKLINLILQLPEDSALRLATRDGDWTTELYLSARIANELMLLRADHAHVHGGKQKPKLILSPQQMAADAEDRQAEADVRQLLHDQIHGIFVPPPQPGRQFDGEVQDAITDDIAHGKV